jgi:hypothetical protein
MPTQMTTAREVILQHQQMPPVNVVAVANDLGVNVWEIPNLGKEISGKIFKDAQNGGSSGYSIGVNATEGYRRKRFTVAHEIAHFILHRDKIGDELTDDAMYRSGLSTREEVQANQLAADILMPVALIRKFQAVDENDVELLADRFQVSVPAMRVRLSYL